MRLDNRHSVLVSRVLYFPVFSKTAPRPVQPGGARPRSQRPNLYIGMSAGIVNEEGGSVRPAQKRVKEARKRAYRRGYPYVDGPATRNEKRWESGALRSYVRCAVRCDRQPRWSPRIGSQHVCGPVKAGDALGFSRSLDRPITTIFPLLQASGRCCRPRRGADVGSLLRASLAPMPLARSYSPAPRPRASSVCV